MGSLDSTSVLIRVQGLRVRYDICVLRWTSFLLIGAQFGMRLQQQGCVTVSRCEEVIQYCPHFMSKPPSRHVAKHAANRGVAQLLAHLLSSSDQSETKRARSSCFSWVDVG